MVNRTYEHVLNEYDKGQWLKSVELIKELISSGVHNLDVAYWQWMRRIVEEFVHISIWKEIPVWVNGNAISMPAITAIYMDLMTCTAAITERLRPNTRTIIELGSGCGNYLINTWLQTRITECKYIAAEFCLNGRLCSDLLASLDSEFKTRYRSMFFDYHKPDLRSLKINDGHALVFSHHSVEQIPEVKVDLFEQILDTAPQVTCLHMEPIGWQIDESSISNNGSSEAYAIKNDYNRNLWKMLKKLELDGRITIHTPMINIHGLNHYNAITIVAWEKKA